jgi:hypothetical protein
MVFLEGVWGIHWGCHQFHRPFSVSESLLVSVSLKVLLFQGDCCLQFRAEFGLWPQHRRSWFSRTGYSLTNYLSGIYDLWKDCREDTLSQRRPFLGTDSKEISISRFLGNLPCCLGSEPQHASHNTLLLILDFDVKVKVKLSLCLTNKSLPYKDVWGSKCTDPRILYHGINWRWVVSFTPRPLYPRT